MARLPCPLTSSRVCSNLCLLSWWCHPAISSTLLSPSPAFSLSQHQGFSNELALCIRWPNYTMFFSCYSIFTHIFLRLGSQRIDVFEQWCWRRLLRVISTAKRSNQSILKEKSWICFERTEAETEDPVPWNEQLTLWYLDPEDFPKQTHPLSNHCSSSPHPAPGDHSSALCLYCFAYSGNLL